MGYTCSVCGKHFDGRPMYSENICSDECFTKDFWTKALDDEAIIINGECYHVGPEDSSIAFRGYGGHKFVIQLKDGRKITTTNLWNQGEIPEEFHREDNAVILEG